MHEYYVQGNCRVGEGTRGFRSAAGAETVWASEGREYDVERLDVIALTEMDARTQLPASK